MLTCKNQTLCNILPAKTTHNLQNLTTFFFKQSFNTSPIYKYIYPVLDFSIFSLTKTYPASFNTPIPFKILYDLANKAEKTFNNLNSTQTNPKRISFFFYTYLKAYLKAAAKNDNIINLNLKEALQKLTPTPIDTQILARTIAYYNIIYLSKPTISQLKYNLQYSYIQQAEQFIIKKFNITIPHTSTYSFFFSNNPTTIPTHNIEQQNSLDTLSIQTYNTNYQLPNKFDTIQNPSEAPQQPTDSTIPETSNHNNSHVIGVKTKTYNSTTQQYSLPTQQHLLPTQQNSISSTISSTHNPNQYMTITKPTKTKRPKFKIPTEIEDSLFLDPNFK